MIFLHSFLSFEEMASLKDGVKETFASCVSLCQFLNLIVSVTCLDEAELGIGPLMLYARLPGMVSTVVIEWPHLMPGLEMHPRGLYETTKKYLYKETYFPLFSGIFFSEHRRVYTHTHTLCPS